jgi:hypothetical protein
MELEADLHPDERTQVLIGTKSSKSKSTTYFVTVERPRRNRWQPTITSPEYKEFGGSRAASNPHRPDSGTPRRGMKPSEQVVDKN